MLNLTLSQWGLLSDMAGVILLFIFGLPSKYMPLVVLLAANDMQGKQKEDAIRRNKGIIIGAYIGLSLVFLGFALQFIGSFK